MVRGGATRICFVIAPGKSDILEYFGGEVDGVPVCYAVQPQAAGLCDAVFRAAPIVPADERVVIGLPDTVWFPEDGLAALPDDTLSFLLFPVAKPELFDAVVTDGGGWVQRGPGEARRRTIAMDLGRDQDAGRRLPPSARPVARARSPGRVPRARWSTRTWRTADGRSACSAGEAYVDVGTLNGYREATRLLATLSAAREARRTAHA